MQIFLPNIQCPECNGHNCVKYVGHFCGVIYGCGDCENTFKLDSTPNNANIEMLAVTGKPESKEE